LLAPGRGLRRAPFEQLIRHGSSNGWAVAADVSLAGVSAALGTAYRPESIAKTRPTRQVMIDGRLQKSTAPLGRHMRILWLTPAMDRIFSGPPGDRRRLCDRLAAGLDPDHTSRLTNFENLMRQRNRLLAETAADPSWISSLEHQMAEEAIALTAGRLQTLDSLAAQMASGAVEAFPWVKLRLLGDLSEGLQNSPAVQVEDQYRRMLRDSRRADRSAGRTLVGPHRADLEVTHGPKEIDAGLCSTGEQKAMLISVVLGHAKAMKNTLGGILPLLLLDEAVAHLDAERRSGLFRELQALRAQCWLTGTDRGLFQGMDRQTEFYAVKQGTLVPIG
jgi:DNA replication and repair protein RecF